jgi:hypothetical protein
MAASPIDVEVDGRAAVVVLGEYDTIDVGKSPTSSGIFWPSPIS